MTMPDTALQMIGITKSFAGIHALAGVDRPTSIGAFGAVRPSIPTGTGLPRASQFGFRFRF